MALADGLPTDAARRLVLAAFPPGAVVLVLVETPPELWVARLARREGNLVDIDLAGAEAYVRDHWQSVAADLPHERVENGDDPAAVDAALRALYRRHAGNGGRGTGVGG
ncbi:MAG: hypothetical protein U0531_17365 [Dehalococcoidia bacterium]